MLDGILLALQGSGPIQVFRASAWMYPAVEVLHIVGFVVLVGAAFILDLRLLGRLRALPVGDAVNTLSRWARWSFVLVVVPSGFLLFAVDAVTLAANGAFRLKLVLMAAAGLNAAVFHALVFRTTGWTDFTPLPLPARAAGVLSILLWFSVIAFGRLIAYV